LLNAVFIAIVAGVGLALFQRVIPRPGLATGLYTNTRRVGAIISGPIIALGSIATLGYRNVFIACAILAAAALPLLLAGRAANL
jgi:SET family sugar efflux transporter-like MFS transporter